MARYEFGGSSADVVWSSVPGPGYNLVAQGIHTVNMWDSETGGTQYTDLLDANGAAITTITPGSLGVMPRFYGPDGVTVMWADAGVGRRVRLISKDAYVPTDAMLANGDSLTVAQQDGEAQSWTAGVASDLGIGYAQNATSGKTSTLMGIRQGGIKPVLAAGITIPASTSAVAVTFTETLLWTASTVETVTGSLGGVAGTLTATTSSDGLTTTYTFAATVAPSAPVTVASGQAFSSTQYDAYRNAFQVIEVGRNNQFNSGSSTSVKTDPNGTLTVRDVDKMIRRLTISGRVLVLTILKAPLEVFGTPLGAWCDTVNSMLMARYGANAIDWNQWLVEPGMAIMGVAPTAADIRAINGGVPPASLRASDVTTVPNEVHLSASAYQAVRKMVVQYAASRGFIVGAIPAAIPTAPGVPTAGAATTTSQALSWSTVTGALGYRVRFKKSIDTKWVLATYTTGTTATVTGLEPNTAYEYELTAWNAAGSSAPSYLPNVVTTGILTTLASDTWTGTAGTDVNARTVANDAGGSTVSTWTTSSAGAVKLDGSHHVTNTAASVQNLLTDMAVSNGRVKAVLTTSATGTHTLLARYSGSGATQCYAAVINSAGTGNVYISRGWGGGAVNLTSSISAGFVSGDVAELEANGSTVTLYRNGVKVVSVIDTNVPTGTKYGVQFPAANGWTQGTLSVTTPPAVNTIASDSFPPVAVTSLAGRTLPNDLGGSLSASWTVVSGTTGIDSFGNLYGPDGLAQFTPGVNSYKVSATVNTFPVSGSVTLFNRYVNQTATGCYALQILPNGGLLLTRGYGGAQVVLVATVSTACALGDVVSLNCQGTTITMEVNGVVHGTVTDSNVAVGGAAAVLFNSGHARLGQFVVANQ